MNFEDDKQKTKRLSKLLSTVEKNTAKPDKELLNKLQEKSTTEFIASSMNHTQSPKTNFPLWRLIMKSNITKLAAAAVITIAVVLPISFFVQTGSVAYSVEQTIEAMNKIRTLHAFGIMNDGTEYECWVQLSQDANNPPYICLSLPTQTVVSTPQWSYRYNREDNSFQTLKGGYLQARADFSNIIEWLYEEAVVPGLCDMTLKKTTGPDGSPQIQMNLTGQIEATFFIDLQTKLLISAEMFSGETGDYVIRRIDRIIYNEPLPEGIFDFEIPEGAQVIEQ